MNSAPVSIKFVVGSRKLFAVQRRMRTVACELEHLIAGTLPDFGADEPALEGYRVLSLPDAALAGVVARYPRHVLGGLQRYRRHYIAMTGSYADYLARFSGKTRSTFNRKMRKLAEVAGGGYAVEEFRTPAEVDRFFAEAIPLSHRTYQGRLLDAGLPESEADRTYARTLAADDRLRAYLLRIEGRAVAYLYLPVHGQTLVYAFLGYDPDYAQYSPGTVLQLEALARLFAEARYGYFDFTEGEGAHKAMFGTDSVEACSFYLLRPRLSNRLLLGGLDTFNRLTARAKAALAGSGALARVRRLLRS